jgi:hypothetical protein
MKRKVLLIGLAVVLLAGGYGSSALPLQASNLRCPQPRKSLRSMAEKIGLPSRRCILVHG